MDTEHGLGNVTGEIMLNTLLSHWIKYYGQPNNVRTDPQTAFRDQGFRRGLAAKSIRLGVPENRSGWENNGYHKTVSNTCGSENS